MFGVDLVLKVLQVQKILEEELLHWELFPCDLNKKKRDSDREDREATRTDQEQMGKLSTSPTGSSS